ncbi:MAG: outer membrane beta-barrel protein [Bdellovibrionales bacterium]|nr:outer membrane beta-barrel protein [Bdellovibrionales bacterium]
MKSKIRLICLCLGFLMSTQLLWAQSPTALFNEGNYSVGPKDFELNFSITPAVIRGSGGNAEIFGMRLGGNYFVTNILAPGLELSMDSGSGFTSFRFLPNLKIFLPLEDTRVLPYAQVGFGYAREVGNNFASFSIGPGVNYLLSQNVAIGAQLRYDLGAGSETLHKVALPIQFAIYFTL